MLTSAFLHSQGFVLHIALNMYMLWLFGQALEPLLGRARFLAVYLLSAIGGSVGFLLLAPGQPVAVIGASGAIFGLFGGLFVVQRQRGGDVRQLVVLIVINAVLGFVVPGIAWQAHLGGLVTGALTTAAIAYAPRGRSRVVVQIGGLVGVAVLLALATVVKVSNGPALGGSRCSSAGRPVAMAPLWRSFLHRGFPHLCTNAPSAAGSRNPVAAQPRRSVGKPQGPSGSAGPQPVDKVRPRLWTVVDSGSARGEEFVEPLVALVHAVGHPGGQHGVPCLDRLEGRVDAEPAPAPVEVLEDGGVEETCPGAPSNSKVWTMRRGAVSS
ncbi:rhomboid family intramembrane serine protease [Sinomonas atrocyanea]